MVQAFITNFGNFEATQFREVPITDSLQSYYDFSDTGSIKTTNTTIYDLMGNGGSGSLKACVSGAVTPVTSFVQAGLQSYVRCDGQGNNGVSTNLVGSRIDINTRAAHVDRFNKYSNFTFQFLVYPEASGILMSTGTSGGGCTDACIWQFRFEDQRCLWFSSAGNTTNAFDIQTTLCTVNAWNFMTITYQSAVGGNGIINVYRNATLVGTQTISMSTLDVVDRTGQANPTLQWTLGGGYGGSCVNYNTPSKWALFLLYNRVLSTSEIKINYNLYKDRFGN